jgi:hypothetical protein
LTHLLIGGILLESAASCIPLQELGPDFDAAQLPLVNSADCVKLLASDVRNGAWDLDVAISVPMSLTLRLLYYPRWQVSMDGQSTSLGYEMGTGYAWVGGGAGTHRVSLRYGRSVAEWIGVQPPLKILWRSILLPPVQVR